jgi:hypothetical protein
MSIEPTSEPLQPSLPLADQAPPPPTARYLTTIFQTGSKELKDYLGNHKTGSLLYGPNKAWKVVQVDVDADIPPHPDTGAAMTQVTLRLE